jgi:hypothetical protein
VRSPLPSLGLHSESSENRAPCARFPTDHGEARGLHAPPQIRVRRQHDPCSPIGAVRMARLNHLTLFVGNSSTASDWYVRNVDLEMKFE